MEIFEMEKEFNDLMKAGQELIKNMKEKHIVDTSKKVERWKPNDGEEYWFIQNDGLLYRYSDGWKNGVSDKGRYKLGNCFKTEQEAQKELDRKLAEQELLDLCDWDGEENVYLIEYNDQIDIFDWNWFDHVYSPYRFTSKESVKKAIDTLGTERLKLIFRIED